MIHKPVFSIGLKLIWFSLVSVLLGPFALWFTLVAKKSRRGLQADYFLTVAILVCGVLASTGFLFFAPVHWALLIGFYLLAAGASAWAMVHNGRSEYFNIVSENAGQLDRSRLGSIILLASLAIFPWTYILALIHNIGELEGFSIRLPSDVYTDGLIWMLCAVPVVALLSWVAWKAKLQAKLRTLVYFYAAILVILLWIMIWEKCDQTILNQIYGVAREPLFFSYLGEIRFRILVKSIFYAGAFLLGIGYLVQSARTSVFLKRTIFLSLPSLLLYANMLFVIGDWNYYLAGLRQMALNGHHFQLYRFAANAGLARTPSAFRNPSILEEWTELEYQSGNRDRALGLMDRLVVQCGDKPYFARIRKRTERSLAALKRVHADSTKPGTDSDVTVGHIKLDLPVIKSAAYLDQEWYALLSAVAFLKPSWTDLELKKRLLDLSNRVQLNLPKLDNVPELIPALRLLEIPVSTCFLTNSRIKQALTAGHVPFLSLYGHWVPITGYDSGRDGFYYYAYQAPGGWDWFRNENTDLFNHHVEEAFGPSTTELRKKDTSSVWRQNLQRFIPAEDLAEYVLDIGGVGMVLGDSAMVGPTERRAAYFVEQGDVYYQEHENYEEAANCYRQAEQLFPNDQIFSRMIYLKRRYWELAADPGDYQNLFRDFPPDWLKNLGPNPQVEKEIVTKIMQGQLGSYLMMNWYVAPILDTATKTRPLVDTAMVLYSRLHRMDPEEPLYTDSLATLLVRRRDLAGAESIYTELTRLFPFGSESAELRLAWTKFKLGKVGELSDILDRCKGYSSDARYLTLKAAVAMDKGHYHTAFSALSHSLKLDKSIGESHALMEAYYRHKGDKTAEQVHHQWQKRSI